MAGTMDADATSKNPNKQYAGFLPALVAKIEAQSDVRIRLLPCGTNASGDLDGGKWSGVMGDVVPGIFLLPLLPLIPVIPVIPKVMARYDMNEVSTQ